MTHWCFTGNRKRLIVIISITMVTSTDEDNTRNTGL